LANNGLIDKIITQMTECLVINGKKYHINFKTAAHKYFLTIGLTTKYEAFMFLLPYLKENPIIL
jgi:hypothetical protein